MISLCEGAKGNVKTKYQVYVVSWKAKHDESLHLTFYFCTSVALPFQKYFVETDRGIYLQTCKQGNLNFRGRQEMQVPSILGSVVMVCMYTFENKNCNLDVF